jgi:hypothetical protein
MNIVGMYRRLPLWIKVSLLVAVPILGHLVDLGKGNLQNYTTTLQAEINKFQPFVLAEIFYRRLGECRYDWRLQCLCSYKPGFKLIDDPKGRGKQEYGIPPGKKGEPIKIPYPTGCVQRDAKWPTSKLEEATRKRLAGEVPYLGAPPEKGASGLFDLIFFVGSKTLGIFDAYKFTVAQLLQGWFGLLLSGATLVLAGLFVVGAVKADTMQQSTVKDFRYWTFLTGAILFISPVLTGIIAFFLKWLLWVVVWAIGKTFAAITVGASIIGIVAKPIETATNISTLGKLFRRWLRQRRSTQIKRV